MERVYLLPSVRRTGKFLENKPGGCVKMQKISRYNKKGSPERALTIFDAMEQEKPFVPLLHAREDFRCVCLYVYPPGIPCLVPGERITREIILQIEEYLYLDLEVQAWRIAGNMV